MQKHKNYLPNTVQKEYHRKKQRYSYIRTVVLRKETRAMMKQADKRNLTMVMDLYELTMANGYFNDGDMEARVAFDVFYRRNPDRGGFAIFAGL